MPNKVSLELTPSLRIIENYPNLHMGPTVLFVLGAIQQPIGTAPADEAVGREKLRKLFQELQHPRPGHGVRIQWCKDISAYVAAAKMPADGLAWDVDGTRPPDINGLVDQVWTRYGKFILAGAFSIDSCVWRPFTAAEVHSIEATLRET